MSNIARLLRRRVEKTPDARAIKYQDVELTWREFGQQVCALSDRLKACNVTEGDVVGVYLDHSLGQALAIFAIANCGGVFSLINPQLAMDQAKHQVQDASMTAMLGSPDLLQPLAEFFANRMMAVEEIDPMGMPQGEVAEIDAVQGLDSARIPADVSNYIYTSGSTGRAKGVVVPHRTLLDGARIVSQYLCISEQDRILSVLPFSFDYGLNQLLSAVHTGASIVLQKFIFPKQLFEVIAKEKVTAMAVVPSMWPKLLRPALKDAYDTSTLRYVTTAGGFHSPELLDSVSEFFPGTEVIVMYGLTESFRSTYLPFSEMRNRPGSIGKPVPEVQILALDADGNPCPPGVKGELVHRGAFVTYGYLNNHELNDQKFIQVNLGDKSCLPETAVRSGDEVSIDEDGFIYFHGRMDQQIKSSGYRISPDEVAQAVMSTPGISQAVVFGLADSTLGEAIHVSYETYDKAPVDLREIKRHTKESLAVYAIPHRYHFYKQLPLTPNGKPDMSTLKLQAAEQVESEQANEQ